MAVYSKLITTENGRTLIARMLSGGEKVVFTKVCSSDREYGLEELGNLEELAEIRQTSSVSKVSRTNDISVKVEAVFTNTELTEGYYMKTVALYARGGEGEEVLYAAAVETSGSCFMPAFGGITVSGAYIQLVTTVSNTENVTLEVDNSVFATIGNIVELQEQIDGISELVQGVVAQVSVNNRKLDKLERIGTRVFSRDISFNKSIPYNENAEVASVPLESIKLLDNDDMVYYLYILENSNGSFVTIYHDNDKKKNLEGFLWITFTIGIYNGTHQVATIAPWLITTTGDKLYAASATNMIEICGRPVMEGIKIYINPSICERADGELKEIRGNLKINGKLTLSVYKIGEIFENLGGGSTGEILGGTSNYNLLTNKPSINNITLQGNLTSAQLGLAGGSGGTVGMTYEEALEILNEAGEEVTKV